MRGYLAVATFGVGSRVGSLVAQLGALFVLARIMTKADFGDMMTAFAAYRIISYGVGTGCMSGLLYHVSRDPVDATEIPAHRTFAALAGIAVLALEIFLLPFRADIAALFGKPGLADWLLYLAPFGLIYTLIYTATGAYDGRQWINRSIALAELWPNLLRLVLLGIILVWRLPVWTVGAAFLLSVAIPYCAVLFRLLGSPIRGMRPIRRWDLHYCATFIGHSLLSMQLQGIDMLIVGYLFSSTQTADYAIAGRIAVMYPFFQQIVFKKFMPRCGMLIARGDTAQLVREALTCRDFSVIAVCFLTGALLALAPWIVRGAGDFTSALALLVALAAPSFARAFFAGGDAILRMSGAANFSIAIMFCSFLFVVVTPFVAMRWLHIFSLPLGMTLSAIVLNPIIAWRIHQRMGFWLFARRDFLVLAGGLVGIAAMTLWAGPEPLRWPVIGAIVALPGAILIMMNARQILDMVRGRPVRAAQA
ncbi:hypothetical protein IP83_01615 [Novosphingobium sp. AAP93]|nr:hypothetical protein IP83_01615 [Novosphingobium sp. AAP93]